LRNAILCAIVVSAVAFCGASGFAQQQPIVLKGGKLLTVSHGVIENGVLVMEGGKISALGAASSVRFPKKAKIIDVSGMTVYPGLIDSETSLGLTEISAENSTNDRIELSDEIMPHMHVCDAFHAESELIPVTRLNGITNAIVAPDSYDTLPGQDSFVQLGGTIRVGNAAGTRHRHAAQLHGRAAPQRIVGKAQVPGNTHGDGSAAAPGISRRAGLPAAFCRLREKKADAARDKKPEPSAPKRDLKLEALLPYLQGKKPIVLAAEGPSDLETAVRLAQEFNLKFVLNHISHSRPVLDYVAGLKVPVIVGPIYETPKEYERFDAVYSLPAELHKRGVKIAFASFDAHNSRNLPYQVGLATGFGLPADEALRAITLNAAEIWGVADQLGSLDVGKTANVVVANGDPLDVKTDVKRVFIGGLEIPMTSRQTRLRDEYSTK
jgi:imidazolonepropionase-like amidohydrolase